MKCQGQTDLTVAVSVDLGEPARQVARMTGFQVSESSSELSPREYIRNYQFGLARLIVEL